MNRRSFLGIIGVGIACPLSLLKAKPDSRWANYYRDYRRNREIVMEQMRVAFENTKFVPPLYRGTHPVWNMAYWDNTTKRLVYERTEGVYCDPS